MRLPEPAPSRLRLTLAKPTLQAQIQTAEVRTHRAGLVSVETASRGSDGIVPAGRMKAGAAGRKLEAVTVTAQGEGVSAGGFGNEGPGGHSHLVYPWKTGQTYRFLVTAKPEGTHTLYSGYFYFPEKKRWGLIASFLAPKDGDTLRGLYS